MSVSARLAALRRQAGATPTPTAPTPSHTPGRTPGQASSQMSVDRARALAELRRQLLGVGACRGATRKERPRERDVAALARLLGGEIVSPGIVRLTTCLARGTRQGEQELSEAALPAALGLLCGSDRTPEPRTIVFMDTETTGLAGGTGTLVFLLGLARFTGRGLEICQLLLTGFHGEEALLELAESYLAGSGTLVSFNGRSFDGPLLAARYRLAGRKDPFASLVHVDLLHATRRAFGGRWPDCRLQTAERRLLGYGRVDDLPGAEAPLAWFEWVRDGRPELLRRACAHNRDDLVSLAALAIALERCHRDPLQADADVCACARFLLRGAGAEQAYRYLLERREQLDARANHELARLASRRREWRVALDIWEHLARGGDLQALEALAKYHEHRARDLARALAVTHLLVASAPADDRHHRRRRRLLARLERRGRA